MSLLNSLMPLEEIERLREDNEEQVARLEEIQRNLLPNMSPEAEQDIDADYDRMMAEIRAEGGEEEAAESGEDDAPQAVPA
jgi:hypothetical protein